MANKMLIDATHPEETRVVVLRGNRVEEFDFETAHRKQLRGNIYLAKVTRVEPSLQAAFVEYGGNRHGFLAFSEIHPDYYQIPVAHRQALIEADARAARDDDEADDHHRGGNRGHRGRNRHRERPHARRDESVSSAPLAATESASDATEIPAGENVTGEPLPSDSYSSNQPSSEPVEQSASEIAHQNEAHADDAPVAEAELPPASTEPPHDEHDHEADASEHQSSESARADHSGEHQASAEGGEQPAQEDNGNGANVQEHSQEEDEEVVDTVGGADAMEEVAERAPRYRRQYKIQEVIKRRQVMLVQVVKEERGTKGAALTTYLSLAGRY